MKQYDMKCPHCGTINKGLYLQETDGWMECEHCGKAVKVMRFADIVKMPIIEMDQLAQFSKTAT